MLKLHKAGIALLGCIAALGIAELLTRTLAPHPRYAGFMLPDERVGSIPKPAYRGRATNMFGEYDTEIRTNKEGFRGRDYSIAKSEKVLRIAILGDSFTFAEQVPEESTFVRRTEILFNQMLRKKNTSIQQIECMNFGVGGYDTYQQALCYEAFVRKYRPDITLLAMYAHNDLLGNAFYLEDNGFGRPCFRLTNGSLQKIPADPVQLMENYRNNEDRFQAIRWYHHLHLYNLWKQALWEIRQKQKRAELAQKFATPIRNPSTIKQLWREGVYHNYRYYVDDDGKDPVVAEADAVTRLLLKRLETMVQEDGGRLCVALLPAEENLWPERWPERVKLLPGLENIPMNFERPFKRVEMFLPEITARGDLLDLRPPLRQTAATGPIFFPRDSHYNLRGQEAVAQAIAAWLEPSTLK